MSFRVVSICIVATAAIAVMTGCTRNILVAKNGERFFLATKQQGLKKILCDSGDMAVILRETKLERPLQEQLFANICAETPNREKTLEILSNMTREQRENLKFSFERNGYDVNHVFC